MEKIPSAPASSTNQSFPRENVPSTSSQLIKARICWPGLLMATLVFASHWQVPPAMPDLSFLTPDKTVHFFVYGLLATLCARLVPIEAGVGKIFRLGFLLAVGFGLVDECVQALNPVRDFSLYDLLADAAGSAVALLCYLYWPFYRNLLEARLWRRKES